ncbi:MAG: hypothetical protein IPP47_19285, partial [Bryobacterales bacterium]|nr:hypothetical protein [Bryobacterales bacterium]
LLVPGRDGGADAGLLLRKLAPRLGEANLVIYGAVIFGIGFVIIAESSALWMLLFGGGLHSTGLRLFGRAALTGLISRAVASRASCWGRRNRLGA